MRFVTLFLTSGEHHGFGLEAEGTRQELFLFAVWFVLQMFPETILGENKLYFKITINLKQSLIFYKMSFRFKKNSESFSWKITFKWNSPKKK